MSGKLLNRKIDDGNLIHAEGSGSMLAYKMDDGHCQAVVAVGTEDRKRWATVYLIQTEPEYRNKGECQKLLIELKKHFEKLDADFAVWQPMNSTMEHICKKLNIKTYCVGAEE